MKELLRIEIERLHHGPLEFERSLTPAQLDLGDDPEFTFNHPVEVALTASMAVAGDSVLLRGTIATVATAGCVRCLHPLEIPARAAFTLAYLRKPEHAGRHENEDDEAFYYSGDFLEPLEQLREELMVALPYLPACEPGPGDTCAVTGKPIPARTFGPSEEPKPESGGNAAWLEQLGKVRERLGEGEKS
jgi:uncharacterized metal-binding protein YceD (DUF177 family)